MMDSLTSLKEQIPSADKGMLRVSPPKPFYKIIRI